MLFGIPIPLLVMLFLGIVIIIIGIVCRIIECVCCTEEVEAVCTQIESRKKRKDINTILYCPIWEFCYEGRYYRVKGKNANNVVNYRIGEKTTLLINPDKPTQYRTQYLSSAVITIIAGVIWTAAIFGVIMFDRAI